MRKTTGRSYASDSNSKLGYQQIGRKLRDRGQHGSQVPEARRGGGHHLAAARGLG